MPHTIGGARACRRSLASAIVLGGMILATVACKHRATAATGVSPVSGPSTLQRLGLSMETTRLGKMGGGAAGGSETAGPLPSSLSGADLYRLSCRACHGPDGAGAPPEISSVTGPASAASPSLAAERMKAQGHPISPELARELATDARKAIRTQILDGGKVMPAFGHLRPDEIDAIIGYLEKRAGAPATEQRDVRVPEPALRQGELLVKGTCHICHDATGPGGPHMGMITGGIPSLESFAHGYSPSQIVAKVRDGRSVMGPGMGMMRGMHGHATANMPAFPYLSPREIDAAYDYLRAVPPRAGADAGAAPANPR